MRKERCESNRPTSLDENALREAAAALAEEARRARSPSKSLAALLRWRYRSAGYTEETCQTLLRLGLDLLLEEAGATPSADVSPPSTPGDTWHTVEAAARVLHRSPDSIKRLLRTREGRRQYGWPWWDGHRWLIPGPAINPASRAAYFAAMPGEEPYAPPPFADR
jgi:hypothetical protein